MNTDASTSGNKNAENIQKCLLSAKSEIEDLVLQFDLGKADAKDKFEELKKEFSLKVHDWNLLFSNIKEIGKEKALFFKSKFEELQIQLALGKADAKDVFEEQRKSILKIINEIESELKSSPELKNHISIIRTEMEKIRIKLEIIKLKFELTKFEMKDGFKNEMKIASEKVENILTKVKLKVDLIKDKYSDFDDEIDLTFKHFKKAVSKLF